MAETPQLKEAHPILNAQRVSSEGEGFENFAKTLASFAQKEAETTIQLNKEKSDTMYMNSVANAEQAKKDAQAQLLEHPENASNIMQHSQENLDQIKNEAYVNEHDRSKLGKYIAGAQGDVKLDAVKTQVQQNRLTASMQHYLNWPDQLKAYSDALNSNPDQADQLHDKMINSLKGLVATRVLTPYQASQSLKDMGGMVDASHQWLQAIKDAGLTARDYHTLASAPISGIADNSSSPMNQDTAWFVEHHMADTSLKGVVSSIYNHGFPDFDVFHSLQPAQRDHAIQVMHGVQVADGIVNSGESFPMVQATLKSLDDHAGTLNSQQEATRNSLKTYVNDLSHGNYLNVIQRTAAGNGIIRSYLDKDAAIRGMAIDDAQKSQLLIQNKNNMVDQAVAYGHGTHTPEQYIQPIPKADVVAVQDAFKAGNDPAQALSIMGQYTKQNRLYLAQAMKNPDQRMVMQTLAILPDNVPAQQMLDFVAANQEGRPDMTKDLKDNSKLGGLLAKQIYGNLGPQLKFIQQNYPAEEAGILQNSMIQTSIKYAKYLGQKDLNPGLAEKGFLASSPMKNYASQASQMYSTAYQPMSGSNYVVNPGQLDIPLSKYQLDHLADYVVSKGYDTLMNGGVKNTDIMSNNPLTMRVSPTGSVQAVDGDNNVIYSEPLTWSYLNHSILETIQKKNARIKARKEAYPEKIVSLPLGQEG